MIEVGDTERSPREKMRASMRDGRIPIGWRVDLLNRCVEIWEPANRNEPVAILRLDEPFAFAGITFTIDELFRTVLRR